jgi:uncharacterized repeat protein (TIGR01451 family)
MGNIYPPAEATDINQTPAVVGPDLTLSKTDNGVTTAPGAVVPYTLNYANVSPTGATGVVITDPVPANATFNAAGSLPTVWSCPDGSPAGTICTTTIGPVPGNSSGSVIFALKVNNPLPSGVNSISNSASIGDDGANGPDPTPGNNVATENTPVNPPQSPPDSGSGGGNGNGSKDSSPPPPPAAPPPAPAAPVVPPEPTPALPVLLLPETGLRTTQTTSLGTVLPVLTAVGLTLTLLSFWAKSRRKK